MKVLMIEFFYPENTYTLELGTALSKSVDLTVACKKNVPLPRVDGMKWKGILYEGGYPKLKGLIRYIGCMLDVAREIKGGHYDVVNIQYMRKPRFEIPVFRLMRRHYGILCNTIHTILPHEAKPSDRALHEIFYHMCDLLIVHNKQVKLQLIKDYHIEPDKICLMPHGVYRQDGTEYQLVTEKKRNKKVHFLFFGQLRKYKGIDILLKAIALIPADKRKMMHITIAGPQYPKLDDTDYEEMARSLAVDDCVTFIRRHIPVEEHAALFNDTDICLFPYKELYGSGALLMAYSFGKPVITTDDPIFEEETDKGRTGLLFSKNDPAAMAEAMQEALCWSADDYEKYQKHIAWMNQEKFNWDKSALILKKAYEEALKK